MTSMPNKLESTLRKYPDVTLRNVENLIKTGLIDIGPALFGDEM
jgi:hypothetical protein